MKYAMKQMDAPKFTESMTASIIDLWNDKNIIDNLVAFDDLSDESSLRNFRLKIVILNVIDWTAKQLSAKGIDVRLTFGPTFPIFVKGHLQMIKLLFFNLIKYLERNMDKGSIDIHCETDNTQDHQNEDHEDTILIKYSFVIRSPANHRFPP